MPAARPPLRAVPALRPATDPNAATNVLHPVDGSPLACPAPLCPHCFPRGWPPGAEQSVGCEHGGWVREWSTTNDKKE